MHHKRSDSAAHSRSHARRHPCQFLAQEMVPCLSALIVERKPSFLGGIPGMPVVVDRTRGNTG